VIEPRSVRLRAHICRHCRTNDTHRDPFFGDDVVFALVRVRRYRCRGCRRRFWRRPRRIPPLRPV